MNVVITGSTGPVGEALVRNVTHRWNPTHKRRIRHLPASELIGSDSLDLVLGRLLRTAA
jgi:dTDP-4-dehydrorhamnose reductase